MKLNKKAVELPINIVVMLIIGIVLFGIGMTLFSNIFSASQDEVDDLNDRVKSGIASLECKGDDWICAPSSKMKNGAKETFKVFIANKGDSNENWGIEIATDGDLDGKPYLDSDGDCGKLLISYPDISVNVASGSSAEFPFVVLASRISDTPCSFVTTANIKGEPDKKTPIIIRVE